MFKNVVQERLLKHFWVQFEFIVANDRYTRENVNSRQVLSHTWVLSHCMFDASDENKKHVHRIIVMGALANYIKAMFIQCTK